MTQLHLLWHFKIGQDDDFDDEAPDIKLIGIYSTEAHAEAAIARLCEKPGFFHWQKGFRIFGMTLDRNSWTEGFVSAYDDEPSPDED